MTSASTRRLGAIAVALAIVTAACSSAASDGPSTTAAPATTVPPTTVPATTVPATTTTEAPATTPPQPERCTLRDAITVGGGPFQGVQLRIADVTTGDQAWEIDLGAQFIRFHRLDGGVLYGSMRAGPLFAVDISTCEELWNVPQFFQAARLELDDVALYTAEEISVAAIAKSDASQIWRNFIDLPDGAVIQAIDFVLAEGVIVVPVGGSQATVYAYDAADGAERWSADLADNASVTGVDVAGGAAYITIETRVEARSLDDGSTRWVSDPGFSPTERATGGPDLVAVADHTNLVALDPRTGETRWAIVHDAGRLNGPPHVSADGVRIIGTDGILRLFDAADGQSLSEVAFAACCTSPDLDAGRVVVNQGGLTTVSDLDGTELWSLRTGADSNERFLRLDLDGTTAGIVVWSTPASL